jgi:hypothetical protein
LKDRALRQTDRLLRESQSMLPITHIANPGSVKEFVQIAKVLYNSRSAIPFCAYNFKIGIERVHQMTQYGLKLIWGGWKDDTVIGFSDRAAKRWGDELKPGTRMLLYETSVNKGSKSVVGEIEVTGTFAEGDKLKAPTEEHDRLLPVKVLRRRREGKQIPLARIRELISDDKWPRQGEAWKPLTKEIYDRLCTELEK